MLPNTPWLQGLRFRQHNHCHRGYFGGGCGSWGGFNNEIITNKYLLSI